MSIKSQQKNMKTIYNLVSHNLGYISGERESGPNGAKKQFLSKSAAFLRALGNDLGLEEFKVTTNPGGIAVSDEVTLMGMWSEERGIYFQISQPLQPSRAFLYRTIRSMKDYSGGYNLWISCDFFARSDYERLVDTLSKLRKQMEIEEVKRRVA